MSRKELLIYGSWTKFTMDLIYNTDLTLYVGILKINQFDKD